MIAKTYWNDEGLHKTYGHNNNGFIWGINYIDEDLDQTIDCEWFKTRQQRNQKYKKRKKRQASSFKQQAPAGLKKDTIK